MKNKKKVIIVSVIALMVLIIIGTTYAYFAAQDTETKTRDVRITTDTTDSLAFEIGKDLSITANQETFGIGKGNASDETTAKAILKANSTTNQATDNYYLYIDIKKNNFIYTSEEQTAEVILSITKPDKSELTSIEGLEYVTVGSVSGFDITESTDLIKVAENKEITATSANNNTTIEEWGIKITFINLETNQAANGGKEVEASIIMQKERIGNLFADYIKSQYTTDGVNGLYLHDSDLANGANDGSLRYAGPDYTMTAKAISAGYSNYYSYTFPGASSISTNSIVIQYCQYPSAPKCNTRGEFYNTLNYDTNKIHYSTYTAALEQAVTDGYLNKGNVNNFVCFGSDEDNCPVDNLYRIIGVFRDKVKLIKYEKADTNLLGENGAYTGIQYEQFEMGIRDSKPTKVYSYNWNKKSNSEGTMINGRKYRNIWSKSDLNTINLNNNFLNNIGEKWSPLITGNKYVVGGFDYDYDENDLYDVSTSTIYNKEILNPNTSIEKYYNGRVGLSYINDYVYSTKIEEWSKTIGEFTFKLDNSWMQMGYEEVTITRNSATIASIIAIRNYGNIEFQNYNDAIRPVFYLSSGAQYVSGEGTESNPYRIS